MQNTKDIVGGFSVPKLVRTKLKRVVEFSKKSDESNTLQVISTKWPI